MIDGRCLVLVTNDNLDRGPQEAIIYCIEADDVPDLHSRPSGERSASHDTSRLPRAVEPGNASRPGRKARRQRTVMQATVWNGKLISIMGLPAPSGNV